ncbi:peptidoglycan DD-metalloendopeptidase family protein [Yimella sp. cx-51]|uniref:peptidoglycan DD-metalloendopeptidase family protein n=1 Tax=Yimella sp. cx-51 TaxID=2770551 RepID=UPI00165DF383|nr:peptidoglycan DD-metalloendopeptidase family protein [Yimella sp. cx-51]MBC9957834.1 peptidoglycan DD-metalloendopeptidase family protein [Yimella sp. cx-51]QTH37975.1 peptidoglycan DD-metalloendopeptidase family protein [Yimella sp. cx-51]
MSRTTHAPRHLKRRPNVAAGVVTSPRLIAGVGVAAAVPAGAGALAPAHAAAPASAPAAAPAAAPVVSTVRTAPAQSVQWLTYGSTGELVKVAQQRLGGLVADGIFGPLTLQKVKSFQQARGLYVDGQIGPITWNALGGYPGATTVTTPKSPTCEVTTVRFGATGSNVTVAQQRLGGLQADGVFGPLTLGRVRTFQASKGLPVTGAVDTATWTALGGAPCGTGGTTTESTGGTTGGSTGGTTGGSTGGGVVNPGAAYKLPWAAGTSHRITQGPGGGFSHYKVYTRHAVDVSMPTGTPIVASRAGVVVDAGWAVGGGGKVVRIKDASGLCQAYMHLDSFNVVPGQAVAQGQQVARSGNTGNSTGPHLHFVMLDCNNWVSTAVMNTAERGVSYPAGVLATSTNG